MVQTKQIYTLFILMDWSSSSQSPLVLSSSSSSSSKYSLLKNLLPSTSEPHQREENNHQLYILVYSPRKWSNDPHWCEQDYVQSAYNHSPNYYVYQGSRPISLSKHIRFLPVVDLAHLPPYWQQSSPQDLGSWVIHWRSWHSVQDVAAWQLENLQPVDCQKGICE